MKKPPALMEWLWPVPVCIVAGSILIDLNGSIGAGIGGFVGLIAAMTLRIIIGSSEKAETLHDSVRHPTPQD
jgi:hypothetical protein